MIMLVILEVIVEGTGTFIHSVKSIQHRFIVKSLPSDCKLLLHATLHNGHGHVGPNKDHGHSDDAGLYQIVQRSLFHPCITAVFIE